MVGSNRSGLQWGRSVCAVLACVAAPIVTAMPRVLMHHPFENTQPAWSAAPVEVLPGSAAPLFGDGMHGKALRFPLEAMQPALRVELGELMPADAWTVALWQLIEEKEWLTAPEEPLLTLFDAENRPILRLTKSGDVLVYEGEREVRLECFDALYWVRGSREHLALTWDAAGSGVPGPAGMVRAYWKARPYAAYAVDLDRRPVAIEFGGPGAGLAVDECYLFAGALGPRALWDLSRHTPGAPEALERAMAERTATEAARPTAARVAAWNTLARHGVMIEAEAGAHAGTTTSPTANDKRPGRFEANNNSATSASGRSHVEPGDEPLSFTFTLDEPGEHVLALRYGMPRRMNALWPQNSTARTPWTENAATVAVTLDGKPLAGDGIELFYPTGLYNGHRGDVEMWAWHTLAGGRRVPLAAGTHTLTVQFRAGLAKPAWDALLLAPEAGPALAHPRWVDLYRIPPAWWVVARETRVADGRRFDTVTVSLRNRGDEPCAYEIIAGPERLTRQTVRASVERIALAPFEEKTFEVVFESDARLEGVSEWAEITLWNEDVALFQTYRLWNVIPVAGAEARAHPVLLPPPNPELQQATREWLRTRAPEDLTPDLRRWLTGPRARLGEGLGGIRAFPSALTGERLAAVDAWMAMDEAALEEYLPHGPAENNGYGTGWERTGLEYSGAWHKMPTVERLEPPGPIDAVTTVVVAGAPLEGKTEPYTKTYTAATDVDMIANVRDTRWQSMVGWSFRGAAPYGDTPLGRVQDAGIATLAEAYYLTGDPAYARQAYRMLRVFARRYTGLTKHFNFEVNREDRDWWGGRIDGRYQSKYGPRTYQALGTYVLDLIWNELTPAERTDIEHNVMRWGMYEAMSGPLFETPSFMAAVNREDMPFLMLGDVLGDPGPRAELGFFYDLYKDIVLPDGMHQCSIGSYGGVGTYITFMQKMDALGVNVYGNNALRHCFNTQPRFIFAGGGFPNIDDGGGVGLNGLGAGFGCPNPEQVAWGARTFGDPLLAQWPGFIGGIQRAMAAPEQKAERLDAFFADPEFPLDSLWPPLFIAEVKGLAMLRNRVPLAPVDWIEVIVDYGLYGGRAHGHPAKLATIPSFNGQIVSMEYGYGMHGKPISTGFHMRSYAHNVVVVDGHDQFSAAGAVPVGRLREARGDRNLQWIDTESDRIYAGVAMRRTVFTTPFGIVDLHRCAADREHTYDWMFHSFGVAATPLPTAAVERLADSGPLTFAQTPRTVSTDEAVQVTWANAPLTKPATKASTALLHENAWVRLWVAAEPGTTLALFGIPMVPEVGDEIDYAMLRRRAAATVFATVQEPWRESTAPQVAGVAALPVRDAAGATVADSAAYALEVRLVAGGRQVFFINASDGVKCIGAVSTDAPVATWRLGADQRVENPLYSKDASFSVRP